MHVKWLALLFFVFIAGCTGDKPKTITDEDLSTAEFINLATPLTFPVLINDELLNKKESDSALINLKSFQSFIPDSVFQQLYPKTKLLKLYLIGKIKDEKDGHYILIKSRQGKLNNAQLFYFNEKAVFLSAVDVNQYLPKGTGSKYCRIDNKFNISFIQERKTATGEMWTNESIYYIDEEGKFIMAMTNSTEDLSDEIMGNPIDTLPRKNKYSADYSSDKKNLVSVRDGTTAKTIKFFIHFSKQNGECVGEVKGDAEWVSKTKAVFRDGNSDCVIEFMFSNSAVTIKEQNGCGSYRGITCFFEGTYPRKKEPAPAKPATKKKR